MSLDIKGNKNTLRIEKKKKKKKKKKKRDLEAIGSDPRTPTWEFNVITTAPANYVFPIE